MEYRYFIYPLQISLFQSFCILLSINFFFQLFQQTPLQLFLFCFHIIIIIIRLFRKVAPLFEFFSPFSLTFFQLPTFFFFLSFISRMGISNIFSKSLPIFTEYIFLYADRDEEQKVQHLRNVDKVNTVQGAITYTIFFIPSIYIFFFLNLERSFKLF